MFKLSGDAARSAFVFVAPTLGVTDQALVASQSIRMTEKASVVRRLFSLAASPSISLSVPLSSRSSGALTRPSYSLMSAARSGCENRILRLHLRTVFPKTGLQRLLAGLQSDFPSIRTVMADVGYESRTLAREAKRRHG